MMDSWGHDGMMGMGFEGLMMGMDSEGLESKRLMTHAVWKFPLCFNRFLGDRFIYS